MRVAMKKDELEKFQKESELTPKGYYFRKYLDDLAEGKEVKRVQDYEDSISALVKKTGQSREFIIEATRFLLGALKEPEEAQ